MIELLAVTRICLYQWFKENMLHTGCETNKQHVKDQNSSHRPRITNLQHRKKKEQARVLGSHPAYWSCTMTGSGCILRCCGRAGDSFTDVGASSDETEQPWPNLPNWSAILIPHDVFKDQRFNHLHLICRWETQIIIVVVDVVVFVGDVLLRLFGSSSVISWCMSLFFFPEWKIQTWKRVKYGAFKQDVSHYQCCFWPDNNWKETFNIHHDFI